MNFSNFDPTLFTLTLMIIFSIFVLFLDDKVLLNIKKNQGSTYLTNTLSKNSFFSILFFLLLFLAIGYQGQYLNFETIDSDVHTYLLVGNDVLNGYLPYENEWDDKGPLLYIFYSILIFASAKNLIIFKILCDVIVFLISFTIAKISYLISKTNKQSNAIFSSFLFILLLSPPWGSVEYSEIFALLFLSLSIYIFLKREDNKKFIWLSGLIYGFATLVNQGSGVFLLLFIFAVYKSKRISDFKFFIFGISIPHIFMTVIYAFRGLLDIYFTTLFVIPVKYSSQNFDFLYEFSVFLREIFYFNPFLYSIIIFLVVISIFKIKELTTISYKELFPYLGILLSFVFFYLGSTGYKHHLIFLIFFLSIIPLSLEKNNKSYRWIFVVLYISSFLFLGINSFQKTYHNLNNLDEIYSNYPLKQLALEIESRFEGEYNIFAIDHSLVLFYLDKENEAYIIHPTNYLEPSIYNELLKIKKIVPNELSVQISKKPNIVLCSQEIRWLLEEVNCEVTDFFKGYSKLTTDYYFDNQNRTYYKDPYRTIDLYINNK